jgi:hypothetical protein
VVEHVSSVRRNVKTWNRAALMTADRASTAARLADDWVLAAADIGPDSYLNGRHFLRPIDARKHQRRLLRRRTRCWRTVPAFTRRSAQTHGRRRHSREVHDHRYKSSEYRRRRHGRDHKEQLKVLMRGLLVAPFHIVAARQLND